MKLEKILELIKTEVKPAMGCTEPVAIALLASHALSVLDNKDVRKIELELSANVYKNACRVGIPGTECTGVETAVALGVSAKKPVMDLTILSSLSEDDIDRALNLKANIPIELKIKQPAPDPVYIGINLIADKCFSKAITISDHANLVFLQNQDRVYVDKLEDLSQSISDSKKLSEHRLITLIETLLSAPFSKVEFLLEGLKMNMAVAEAGLQMDKGLKVGLASENLFKKELIGKDPLSQISVYTASACDARMSAVCLPVMSSAGSGNHGLVAIIPIAVAARILKKSEEKVAMALAISHLVTIYIKQFTGRLSPVCGCSVAAGAGASAGLVFLLGGNNENMKSAVNNMVSCFAGMVCDGGKVGCALKLSASAAMAWQFALLALEGSTVPPGNGIVGETIEHTLKNLGKLSCEGMAGVEDSILTMLTS